MSQQICVSGILPFRDLSSASGLGYLCSTQSGHALPSGQYKGCCTSTEPETLPFAGLNKTGAMGARHCLTLTLLGLVSLCGRTSAQYGGGGFVPQLGGFGPQQGGFGPQQGGFVPQQGGFGPQQGGFGPQPGGFGPQLGGFGPQAGGYGPQLGGFGPQAGGFGPQPGGFGLSQRPIGGYGGGLVGPKGPVGGGYEGGGIKEEKIAPVGPVGGYEGGGIKEEKVGPVGPVGGYEGGGIKEEKVGPVGPVGDYEGGGIKEEKVGPVGPVGGYDVPLKPEPPVQKYPPPPPIGNPYG